MNGAPRLLLIEDNHDSAEMITMYLQGDGFVVDSAENAISGISKLKYADYDLVVLDINLPDYNGFDVCTKIRKESSVPIIVVSGNKDVESKLLAFRLGADDFMTKPIDLRESSARVMIVLRRRGVIEFVSNRDKTLFSIDEESGKVYFSGRVLPLTAIESMIFKVLYKNVNRTVQRASLLEALGIDSDTRTIDYHIKNIRRKLAGIGEVLIKTEYGSGYRLDI